MAYPDDFDTSAFPAGKRIAVSRTAGIWIMVSFLLIILSCLAIPWIINNKMVEPFVIYVDGPHGQWRLVGRQSARQEIPYYTSMQRALVATFVQEWFSLSDDPDRNAEHWSQCDRKTVCANRVETSLFGYTECGIYCLADETLYRTFTDKVLPLYQTTASFGERWFINPTKIFVMQNGDITESGGLWIARANVRSSLNGEFKIVAYVRVVRDMENYPQTLGYSIAEFNAYREQ
jgi:hypothetical protein